MSLECALAADRAGLIEPASIEYEHALAAGDRSLTVLLNLALLYWQATDPGLAAGKNLAPVFFATAGQRFPELLNEAEQRFQDSTAARFWKRYIAWADLGEPLDGNECRRLLEEDPGTLVPAMWIFADSAGREAQAEAHELLRQCRQDGTTGARYVVSVIEGVMNRS